LVADLSERERPAGRGVVPASIRDLVSCTGVAGDLIAILGRTAADDSPTLANAFGSLKPFVLATGLLLNAPKSSGSP